MDFNQALEVVNQVKDNNRLVGLLETLEFMQVPSNREELTSEELRAHRVVFTEMRKLFVKA